MIIDEHEWNFRSKLHGALSRAIELDVEQMTKGVCPTFDHYKHLAGRIEAFREVLELSKSIVAASEGRDISEQ